MSKSDMAIYRQLRVRHGLSIGNLKIRYTFDVQLQSEHSQMAETFMSRFATGIS